MTETTRFALPLLHAGQAQKEQFHNEALTQIDTLLYPVVQAVDLATPPVEPSVGQAWVVGQDGDGAWADRDGKLATWTDGGWRFATPVLGMTIWVEGLGLSAHFSDQGWEVGVLRTGQIRVGGQQVVGAQQDAIADPSGGETEDMQSRNAIVSILMALRSHGLIARE